MAYVFKRGKCSLVVLAVRNFDLRSIDAILRIVSAIAVLFFFTHLTIIPVFLCRWVCLSFVAGSPEKDY